LNGLVEEAMSLESIQGKLFIDTSTVHPSTSSAVAKTLGAKGADFIASPVFGASPVAADGKLIFAMAGPQEQIMRVSPYIQNVMGRQIINMGADVQNSSLLKISGNIFVIGFQELIAEAQVFAEKTGLGTARMEEFIGSMFGPVLESYSRRMTSGSWAPPLGTPPGFAVSLASKDARHALAIAEEKGTQLPTLTTALSRMTKAREYAGESLDSASVYGIARLEAGLPFWSENSRQSN
jgi:3-hydroxyisobutyrate dehydrogenase-like beta-hydroxyacid dehydrogenase